MSTTDQTKGKQMKNDEGSSQNRSAHLEDVVNGLANTVSDLVKVSVTTTSDLKNLTNHVSTLSKDVKTISAPKKFDWNVLISAVGLMLLFWAAGTRPLQSDISELKLKNAKYLDELIEQSNINGKNQAEAESFKLKIKSLEDQVNNKVDR